MATTSGSFIPKTPRSCRGTKRKKTPMKAAPARPMRAATLTPSTILSGLPTPRF